MNKKIPLVIAVVLVLGVGAYFLLSKSKTGSPIVGNQASSGMNSIKDLISAGIPQKCTYSTTDESGTSEGTSYVAGGKVRTDATNTANGKTTTSHMITDGKTTYIWTEGEPTGYKTTVQETETGEASVTPSEESTGQGETNINQKVDYKCSAWVPNESLFNPPSDVTFTDLSEMMKASPTTAPQEGNSSQCAYCESLSGEAKTQCLSSFNCQ